MPDLDTCRMPRDKLLSLIHRASENERITAPIPIPTLTALLGDELPRSSDPEVQPEVVVRFKPTPTVVHVVERSHWIIAISATATLLVGIALIFFA
jgi:hypothetical protein